MISGDVTTISGGTTGSTTMVLGGTLQSGGDLTINGSSTTGNSVITITGATTSLGSVAINGGSTGTLVLTQTGALKGTDVTVTGSTGAVNSIHLFGPVTATTGNITVTTATDTVASFVVITGPMSVTGVNDTEIDGSASKADNDNVTPSKNSPFTFNFGTGANFLFVNTATSNILSSDGSTEVTFTPASAFQAWVIVGTVAVSPTVP
jgi:hypothetical protein